MDGLQATDVLPTRHRFTVEDVLAMERAGLFHPEARTELIDGEVIDVAPTGYEHGAGLNSLACAVVMACGDRATAWIRSSVRLGPMDLVQPDFAVLRPRDDFYAGRHPEPADTFLMVEVSWSTLRYDRTTKLPLYARAGIPEYWIVDLHARKVLAHRNPSTDGYDPPTTHERGERLPLAAAPEIVVPLDIAFP